MAMLGDLADFSLPDILQMFERAKKAGQLSIWSPNGIYRIWFYQGRVIAAIAPEEQSCLKQLLIKHAAIDYSVFDTSDAISSLREPLGNWLRKCEIIKPSALAQVFRLQIKTGLYNLFTLKAGQFCFAADVPWPYEEMTGLSKGALEAAMEGLRQVKVIIQQDKELPHSSSVFIRLVSELPLLKFTALEWSIWEHISSDKSLQEIALQVQADVLEVSKVCLRLMQIGLIEQVASPAAPPAILVEVPVETVQSPYGSPTSFSTQLERDPADLSKSAINPGLLNRLASVLKAIR